LFYTILSNIGKVQLLEYLGNISYVPLGYGLRFVNAAFFYIDEGYSRKTLCATLL